jgi:hypothetical protein
LALCFSAAFGIDRYYGHIEAMEEVKINKQLIEMGVYGLTPEEASKIMREKTSPQSP